MAIAGGPGSAPGFAERLECELNLLTRGPHPELSVRGCPSPVCLRQCLNRWPFSTAVPAAAAAEADGAGAEAAGQSLSFHCAFTVPPPPFHRPFTSLSAGEPSHLGMVRGLNLLQERPCTPPGAGTTSGSSSVSRAFLEYFSCTTYLSSCGLYYNTRAHHPSSSSGLVDPRASSACSSQIPLSRVGLGPALSSTHPPFVHRCGSPVRCLTREGRPSSTGTASNVRCRKQRRPETLCRTPTQCI